MSLITTEMLDRFFTLMMINGGEQGERLNSLWQFGQLGKEIYETYTKDPKEEMKKAYKEEFNQAIVEYIKKNPKATSDQLMEEIKKQIVVYALKSRALDQKP